MRNNVCFVMLCYVLVWILSTFQKSRKKNNILVEENEGKKVKLNKKKTKLCPKLELSQFISILLINLLCHSFCFILFKNLIK